jgi:hypothetical protein
MTPRALSGS